MKYFCGFLIVLLTAFAANAQTNTDERTSDSFEKYILARSGWTTPVFAEEFEDSKRSKSDFIGIVFVTEKVYRRKNQETKYFVNFESCSKEADDLKIALGKQEFARIYELSSYETNGKTFAYKIVGVFQPRGAAGAAATLAYYIDKDGDGNFELNCEGNGGLKSVPRWAAGIMDETPPPLKIRN